MIYLKSFFAVTLLSAITLMTISCSEDSAKLRPKPDKVELSSDDVIFSPKLDLLFVIDDSGSMDIHQTNLINNLGKFVDKFMAFKALDYQIGVITTDKYDDGKLKGAVPFVTKNTPDGIDVLKNNLYVGDSGDGYERVFLPFFQAYQNPYNKGFFRPDSILVTVIITDTDDQSETLTAQSSYDMFLNSKNMNKKKLTAFGILADGTEVCPGEETTPVRLREFLKLMNGKEMSLCATDYGEKLAAFGEDLRKIVSEMTLPTMPIPGTINVYYGNLKIPQDIDKGWSYNPTLNSIHFGSNLDLNGMPDGLNFDITYDEYKP